MRRLALVVVGAAAVVALLAVGVASLAGGGSSDYRVDAIFDTAKGIIPGQLVKVAGARVGTIKDVRLTRGYKARIAMEVDPQFAPFRADARCQIKPEGLISENFVNCDPGTPASPKLRASGGHVPTVPLANTSVPINITDLFNIWQVPVRQRLTVLVNTLGMGTSARGEDLNGILARASPTIGLVRRAVGILSRQRAQVAGLVADSDRVIGELARRRDRVNAFIDSAANVTTTTAAHRGALAESVRRLPALLSAARPALTQLDQVAIQGAPVVGDLRASAPALSRLVRDLGPFADAATPTLRALGPAVRAGERVVASGTPVVALLRQVTGHLRPVAGQLLRALVNLRDRGGVENLLRVLYSMAGLGARFDRTSHIAPALLLQTSCVTYATTLDPACSARFDSASGGGGAGHQTGARTAPGAGAPPAPHIQPPARAAAGVTASAPATPGLSAPGTPDQLAALRQRLLQALGASGQRPQASGLLDYLLR